MSMHTDHREIICWIERLSAAGDWQRNEKKSTKCAHIK